MEQGTHKPLDVSSNLTLATFPRVGRALARHSGGHREQREQVMQYIDLTNNAGNRLESHTCSLRSQCGAKEHERTRLMPASFGSGTRMKTKEHARPRHIFI